MAYADGNIIIGTSVDVKGMQEGLKKINSSFKSLSRLAVGALSIKVLTNFSEAALNAASDLQEVQNVVDVSFGDMAYKINNFASTAIEKFGMSELAAKQTGGSFMAMGKAIGFNAEQASDMAVSLTALTGDFASFYNISQDYARVAMSAVYTGETETLKRYGIVLTQANLQEFASAHGIDVKVKNMTAAQKAYIRYMYILNATKDVEGDFVRTQNSWANSVRVLQERWKQFLIMLGNGLMTVLTPVLQFLNYIVAALIKFVNVLGAVLSKLFGIKWKGVQNSTQGTADATGGLADNADDAADAEDKLGKSTKKAGKAAKQSLAAWDDLNVLQKNTSGSGAGGKGGSGGGAGDFDFDMPDVSSLWQDAANKLKLPDFDSLFDVGRWVSDGITNQLKKIPWDKIYKAADNFGKGLADFLNGLITPELFAEVGKTLANCINTAFHFLDSFGKEFDWSNFGKSLGAGLNAFMKNLDWKLILDTAKTWGTGIANAINSFFKESDFYSVGYTIAQMLNTAILFVFSLGKTLKWGQIGRKIADAINGFFRTFNFKRLADTIDAWVQGIAEMIKEAITHIKWKDVLDGIYEFVSNLDFKTISIVIGTLTIAGIGKAVLSGAAIKVLEGAFTLLSGNYINAEGLQGLAKTVANLGNALATAAYGAGTLHEALSVFLGPIATALLGINSILGGVILSVYNFIEQWKNGASVIPGLLQVIGGAIAGLGLVILGVAGWPAIVVVAVIAAAGELVIIIKDHWKEISAFLGEIPAWFNTNIIEPVSTFFSNLGKDILGFFSVAWEGIKIVWNEAVGWFDTIVISPLLTIWEDATSRLYQFFYGCWILIKAVWITVTGWFQDIVITPLQNAWKNFKDTVGGFFTNLWEKIIKPVWNKVVGWFKDIVINPLQKAWEDFKKVVGDFFTDLWSDIKEIWKVVKAWFTDTVIDPVKQAFDDACGKIKGFFDDLWDGISRGAKSAFNNIISFCERAVNGIISGINAFFKGFNWLVDKAAAITGDNWTGIQLLSPVSLPRLAQGAVIPPNKEFMAMLGDQKSGTNIEAPLDTIVQAMRQALSSMSYGTGNQEVTLEIDGRTLAHLTVPYNLDELNRRGYNVSVLEGN